MAKTDTSSASLMKKLLGELNSSSYNYKERSEKEKRKVASQRYKATYDEKRLAANQSYETTSDALDRELNNTIATYNKQREDSAEQYANAYSTQDRASLQRGMARSSYNNATLSNILTQGAQAQQDINDAEAVKTQEIEQQRTTAARQLADTLSQYTQSEQADILAYMDTLTEQDYERLTAAQTNKTNLMSNLYGYAYTKEKDAQEQSNWEREFAAKYGGRGGSGGRKNSGDTSSTNGSSGTVYSDTSPLSDAYRQIYSDVKTGSTLPYTNASKLKGEMDSRIVSGTGKTVVDTLSKSTVEKAASKAAGKISKSKRLYNSLGGIK